MGGGLLSDCVDPSRVVADAVELRHHQLIELLVVAVGMVILSVRRGGGATIVLATLAAETAFAFLAYAIAYGNHRDRLQNVAIAAAVLTGTALWRTRRAVPVA